ncbi:MAG TPA: SRPBCC domain-containing protein [Prolixibacteraceae bacterium]|nr:SRPBCC domain-containing protein [Prolixibacteraceae bacterium]
METKQKVRITVETNVNVPIYSVWEMFTAPEHITKWNNASDDWHTTHVENDVKKGGKFLYRMEAKDKSVGFDFEGVYDEVKINQLIEYTISDGRKVRIVFTDHGDETKIVETFETEEENSIDLQREGWQSIMNNFKRYAEKLAHQAL